uniref:Transaldolase n=1 Tax=Helicotheca tamesis TaxID=374047 RepID=A0A7S2HL33_9STRA|mmetsp:Transcript_1902/g.2721  ORF Transcript_1902/g.2721 Transcript_1902/m.2721 type:complete len:381 (+) Transcript_1902:74-1216(+)
MISSLRLPLALAACLLSSPAYSFAPNAFRPRVGKSSALGATTLESLAEMTKISIDSCDLDEVEEFAKSNMISDVTTNPFFVWQAASKGDKRYEDMVTDAVIYAKEQMMTPYGFNDPGPVVNMVMDKLAVTIGAKLVDIVPRHITTAVDIRLCDDTDASVERAKRIVGMYEEVGVDRSRIVIELAGTWEGIQAASILEKEGIKCKISLVFTFLQAAAAAQAGVYSIEPFAGRVTDWHKEKSGREGYIPAADPGVLTVKRIYSYLRHYDYDTICMPGSWRPSGAGDEGCDTDQIFALAGVDEMIIPPPILKHLMTSEGTVVRECDPTMDAAVCCDPNFKLTKETWDTFWGSESIGVEKLNEGIKAFSEDAKKLEELIIERFN